MITHYWAGISCYYLHNTNAIYRQNLTCSMELPALSERFLGTDQKGFSSPLAPCLDAENRLESVSRALKMGRKPVITTGFLPLQSAHWAFVLLYMLL